MLKSKCMPMYMQVVEDIKKGISGKTLKQGSMLPNELELAEKYGIARATLRSALAVLEKEGFIIRKKFSGTMIADEALHNRHLNWDLAIVTTHDFTNTSSYVDLLGDQHELGFTFRRMVSKGIMLRLLPWHYNGESVYNIDDIISKKGIDGFIISPPLYMTEFIDKIIAYKAPHIALESHYDRPGVNTLMTDDEQVAYDAVSELYRLGHRRIAYCGGLLKLPELCSGIRRMLIGFLRACRDLGIELRDDWIQNFGEDCIYNQKVDFALLAEKILIDRNDLPTAVFCATDLGAKAIVDAAAVKKIRIPEYLSVVCGYLNNKNACENLEITGYVKQYEMLGKMAFDMLTDWLTNPRYRPHCNKVYPEKILGKTVAVPQKYKGMTVNVARLNANCKNLALTS